MNKSRIIRSGFRVMGRHKLRSFFMMIGIVLGVTILTLVMSLGRGMEMKVMSSLKMLFNESNILISAGGGPIKATPLPTGPVTTTLTLADLEALQSDLPGIFLWDPMQTIASREVRFRGRSAATRIFGQSERADVVWNRGVTKGEFFDTEAVASASRVALIGATLAAELFAGEDPIGEQIQIGDVPFRVIGLLEHMGTDPHGMDRDHEIIVPISTAMRRLMNVDYIATAKLVVKDPGRIAEMEGRIREILRERHRLASGEEDDFRLLTPVKVRDMIAGMNKMFNLFLPLIAGLAVLIGAIIVANLMLVSVQERSWEIGLRKSVGARGKDIFRQFLMEATTLALAGGLIGILVGNAAAALMAGLMKIPRAVSWPAVAAALILTSLAGILAGVLPARRAAGLDPVKTLR